LIRR
jgi:hypothetical protein